MAGILSCGTGRCENHNSQDPPPIHRLPLTQKEMSSKGGDLYSALRAPPARTHGQGLTRSHGEGVKTLRYKTGPRLALGTPSARAAPLPAVPLQEVTAARGTSLSRSPFPASHDASSTTGPSLLPAATNCEGATVCHLPRRGWGRRFGHFCPPNSVRGVGRGRPCSSLILVVEAVPASCWDLVACHFWGISRLPSDDKNTFKQQHFSHI